MNSRYTITYKRGDSAGVIQINRDGNADGILRGLLHDGYEVTIKENPEENQIVHHGPNFSGLAARAAMPMETPDAPQSTGF